MATQLFNGVIAPGQSEVLGAVRLPVGAKTVVVSLASEYAATAGTTGVELLIGLSIDGSTFSDFAQVVTTAPSGSNPSTKVASVSVPGVVAVQFKLANLDATNDATSTLQYLALN